MEVFKIPVLKRFCFCLPLSQGMLIWGYLRVVTATLLLTLILYFLPFMLFSPSIGIALVFMALADLVTSVTFIIGCVQKNLLIMSFFYHYSQTMLALGLGILVWVVHLMVKYIDDVTLYDMQEDLFINFANICLQVYMLLIIRSKIIKLKNKQNNKLLTQEETECALLKDL